MHVLSSLKVSVNLKLEKYTSEMRLSCQESPTISHYWNKKVIIRTVTETHGQDTED